MGLKNKITKVEFIKPPYPNGRKEYYFGSITAIFDTFNSEEIGCKLKTLWKHHIDVSHPYISKNCIISKQILQRKKQKKS